MNLEFMDRIGPRVRLAITSFTVVLCISATFVLGYIMEEAVIYTHFYYIPVVLAALWYQRRGLIVPSILVGFYLLSLGMSTRGLETDDYLRSVVLILVGFVVGELSNMCSTARKEISGSRDMLDDLVRKRTAELNTANEKLALMGRMTRHDLVNSLSVLSGWLELAIESKDEAECRTYLGRATETSDTMRAALDFAGEYERIGAKSPTWMELRKAFTSGMAGLPVEGVRFIDHLSDTEVYADPMLDKVFRNLIDNSLRHGGKVTSITLSAETVDGNLTLTYEDDGKGLSDDDRKLLFEPGHGRHTGLGMYFAKKVLEITGISIEERGVSGSGAKFVITVPAAGSRPMTRTTADSGHG